MSKYSRLFVLTKMIKMGNYIVLTEKPSRLPEWVQAARGGKPPIG